MSSELIDPGFIHLRLHSEYSLLRGAGRIKALPELVRKHGQPALALTDRNNLFGALEFSEKMVGAGIQPIMGMEVELLDAVERSAGKAGLSEQLPSIVLLAKNEAGYRNLLSLHSCLYLGKDRVLTGVCIEELERFSEGLICLSGAARGPLGAIFLKQGEKPSRALAEKFTQIYPERLYIELQRHPGPGGLPSNQSACEPFFLDLAESLSLPLVATNDVHFIDPEMFEAHDAMLCIGEGAYVDQSEPRFQLTDQHYFKSSSEMATLFADLPEALEASVEIAKRCAYRPRTHAPILPRFAEDEVEELRRQSKAGLIKRLSTYAHGEAPAEEATYLERLEYELGVIEAMGFPGYFLIVSDFIKWAKARDIPVGPGRGSGAGSLVAWALTITDLDPLRYGLLFERFLNPDRISMPDFDIDFCMDRREEVITYVQGKYGSDRVAQIITFGALLSKAAVRDVGRVLQLPYGQVDRLSKLIPVEGVKPVSVEKALKEEPRLAEEAKKEEVVGRLMAYASKVEGLLRNASTHAAGVVIGDRPLDELIPLYRDPKSDMPATGFNMGWAEAAGLVKFDFLGLKTLTIVQKALEYLKSSGLEIDIAQIPLDDEASFALYREGRTVAVFQVESAGMIDALRRMRPTCIEDIVALVALYRPGPMENIPKYCEVKNGISERERLHPSIDHLLDETQGIIVYQEQVMQIAQEMAGYSLGGADLLRRAMGKKKKEAMDAERPKFIEGAEARGVSADKALEIWNLLEKFANYGFNKSHAAAYALVSYQTAWLKANHPLAFMAGVMQCDIHLTEKLAVYAEEVSKPQSRGGLGLRIAPPCVNASGAGFELEESAIRYALGALKNVGMEVMRQLVSARSDAPFSSLYDFARRVDLRRIGKRPLEMLARAGAFDVLNPNRKQVFTNLDALISYSTAIHEQRGSDQVSLFGNAGEDLPEPRFAKIPDWSPAERLGEEFAAIGFYLSGHPLDSYLPALKRKEIESYESLSARLIGVPVLASVAGVVVSRKERKSAKGNRFAFVSLSDASAQFEITLFSEALEASRELLEAGTLVVAQVEAIPEEGQLRLIARKIKPLKEVVSKDALGGLCISIETAEAISDAATLINKMRSKAGKGALIRLRLLPTGENIPCELDLGDQFKIEASLREELIAIEGVLAVDEL